MCYERDFYPKKLVNCKTQWRGYFVIKKESKPNDGYVLKLMRKFLGKSTAENN